MKSVKINFTILLVSIFTLATAQTGNPPSEKWYKILSGDKRNYISDIIPVQDGGYFVVGSTNSTKDDFKFCSSCDYGSTQAFVLKVDHQGNTLWSKILLPAPDRFNDYDSYISSGVEVNDGFVAVGYMKNGGQTSNEFHLVKLNKNSGDLI